MGWVRVEEMTDGRNNRILGEELLKIKSLPAHRHKELRFLWVETVLESVEKKCTSNSDLVSCYKHEIQRAAEWNNHQDYSANQPGIQITGAFFLYGLFTISTHRKRSPLCRPFCTFIQ